MRASVNYQAYRAMLRTMVLAGSQRKNIGAHRIKGIDATQNKCRHADETSSVTCNF
jgi:hypothetical protein